MKRRYVSYIFIYLILATITLTASVLAWNTLSKSASLIGLDSDIANFHEMIDFYVKRNNDQDFIKISTIEEMHDAFGTTAPGESYQFRIDIDNKLNRNLPVEVYLPDFESVKLSESSDTDPSLYNILEVFYLKDGYVSVETKSKTDNQLIDYVNYSVDVLDETEVTLHNQVLSEYRIANLMNEQNAIKLLNYEILYNTKVSLYFTLVYDVNTSDNNYQELMLAFSGIFIYSEEV